MIDDLRSSKLLLRGCVVQAPLRQLNQDEGSEVVLHPDEIFLSRHDRVGLLKPVDVAEVTDVLRRDIMSVRVDPDALSRPEFANRHGPYVRTDVRFESTDVAPSRGCARGILRNRLETPLWDSYNARPTILAFACRSRSPGIRDAVK